MNRWRTDPTHHLPGRSPKPDKLLKARQLFSVCECTFSKWTLCCCITTSLHIIVQTRVNRQGVKASLYVATSLHLLNEAESSTTCLVGLSSLEQELLAPALPTTSVSMVLLRMWLNVQALHAQLQVNSPARMPHGLLVCTQRLWLFDCLTWRTTCGLINALARYHICTCVRCCHFACQGIPFVDWKMWRSKCNI